MRFLAWNCRGLSRASAIRSLRGKIRKHSPEVIFLSEIKTVPSAAAVILNGLGYFNMAYVSPSGSIGGLLLVCRHGVDIDCFSVSVNKINAWCYSDPPPPTLLGYFLVFMVLLINNLNMCFGSLFCIRACVIMDLGCV
jgi:hypothetical protein